VEYQDIIGPEKSLAVPYADNFDAHKYPTTQGMPNFCGASLSAFVKLAQRKGYRLVGCNRSATTLSSSKTTSVKKKCLKSPWPIVSNIPRFYGA